MEQTVTLVPSAYYDNQPKRCFQCQLKNPGITFVKAIEVKKETANAFLGHMFSCNWCSHEFVLVESHKNIYFKSPIQLVYELEAAI